MAGYLVSREAIRFKTKKDYPQNYQEEYCDEEGFASGCDEKTPLFSFLELRETNPQTNNQGGIQPWTPPTEIVDEPTYPWETDSDSEGSESQKVDLLDEYVEDVPKNYECIPHPQQESPLQDKPEEYYAKDVGITEDDARDLLLEHVHEIRCYGASAARDMIIHDVQTSCAICYELETFTESRRIVHTFLPYKGSIVDSGKKDVTQSPWEIICQPDREFYTHHVEIEMDNTSTVKDCHICVARGFLRCVNCNGKGVHRCIDCLGTGYAVKSSSKAYGNLLSCNSCDGVGHTSCHDCNGSGCSLCDTCEGYTQLRFFKKLVVSFINHTSSFIIDETDIPCELLGVSNGTVILEQTGPYVFPLSDNPSSEVNINSENLIERHKRAWSRERRLKQRHRLREVPVTCIHYTWHKTSGKFWVYGEEAIVYAPKYPQTYCLDWRCNIL
ncbi:protein SSUH2 homolog [Glandiceps talaboti]